jgi:hypothetical protein
LLTLSIDSDRPFSDIIREEEVESSSPAAGFALLVTFFMNLDIILPEKRRWSGPIVTNLFF